jgi:uncharacterized membrane protein
MQQFIRRIWYRWILSTFVTGVFALLPVMITVIIMSWVGNTLVGVLGPRTLIGTALREIGLRFVTDPTGATLLGWVLVLLGIWVLGAFIQSTTRHRFDQMFHTVMHRLPIIGTVYKPVSQVVGLLHREGQEDLQGMAVVFCAFGADGSAGFLGFLTSPERYRIRGQDCRLIYIPTSPIPASGGLVFVPDQAVTKIDMAADDVMKIYFSLGVLASQVIPEQYRTP